MKTERVRWGLALATGAIALLATAARAQSVANGARIVRAVCQSCHGLDGIAKLPEAANLAGQDAGYISRQLQAFKSGSHQNEVMNTVAKGLTDDQMDDVAAYYSAVRIRVEALPGGTK